MIEFKFKATFLIRYYSVPGCIRQEHPVCMPVNIMECTVAERLET
jgi:hypothetical protein